MPDLVEMLVIGALYFAVLARRNLHLHPLLLGLVNDGVAIVATVSNEMLGFQPFDQLESFATVRCRIFSNHDSHRQTMRIHSQMYFGVKPPLVSPMSSLPP